ECPESAEDGIPVIFRPADSVEGGTGRECVPHGCTEFRSVPVVGCRRLPSRGESEVLDESVEDLRPPPGDLVEEDTPAVLRCVREAWDNSGRSANPLGFGRTLGRRVENVPEALHVV